MMQPSSTIKTKSLNNMWEHSSSGLKSLKLNVFDLKKGFFINNKNTKFLNSVWRTDEELIGTEGVADWGNSHEIQ